MIIMETAFLIFEAAEGALPSTSRSCCNVSSWCRKHDVDQSSHRGVLMMPLILRLAQKNTLRRDAPSESGKGARRCST